MRLFMAKLYRTTSLHVNKSITGLGTACFQIAPIDSDQTPDGFVKSVKVSLLTRGTGFRAGYLVVASTDDDPVDRQNWVTAQAVGEGSGGTIWLNLKRRMASAAKEQSRNDGPIYIHVIGSTTVQTDLFCEAWGRYMLVSAI